VWVKARVEQRTWSVKGSRFGAKKKKKKKKAKKQKEGTALLRDFLESQQILYGEWCGHHPRLDCWSWTVRNRVSLLFLWYQWNRQCPQLSSVLSFWARIPLPQLAPFSLLLLSLCWSEFSLVSTRTSLSYLSFFSFLLLSLPFFSSRMKRPLTECCVCAESLCDPMRTLPCLHSACLECLDKLIQHSTFCLLLSILLLLRDYNYNCK